MMGVWNWQQGKRAKGRSQWNEIMCVLFFCLLFNVPLLPSKGYEKRERRLNQDFIPLENCSDSKQLL